MCMRWCRCVHTHVTSPRSLENEAGLNLSQSIINELSVTPAIRANLTNVIRQLHTYS